MYLRQGPTSNGFVKRENGIVNRLNNAERNRPQAKNKYLAAFGIY